MRTKQPPLRKAAKKVNTELKIVISIKSKENSLQVSIDYRQQDTPSTIKTPLERKKSSGVLPTPALAERPQTQQGHHQPEDQHHHPDEEPQHPHQTQRHHLNKAPQPSYAESEGQPEHQDFWRYQRQEEHIERNFQENDYHEYVNHFQQEQELAVSYDSSRHISTEEKPQLQIKRLDDFENNWDFFPVPHLVISIEEK